MGDILVEEGGEIAPHGGELRNLAVDRHRGLGQYLVVGFEKDQG